MNEQEIEEQLEMQQQVALEQIKVDLQKEEILSEFRWIYRDPDNA